MPPSSAPDTRFTTGLDHAGIFAHSLDDIARCYERLGFQLTPQSQHASIDPQTGRSTPRGTANRCAMLTRGYIELLGIVDPSLDARGVDKGLEHHAGLHIMALGCSDPETSLAALRARGFSALPADLRRYADTPQGPQLVVFSQVRVPPAEMPEGMVFLLRHETPQWLWQAHLLAHPNSAQAFTGIVVQVADLDEAGQRYARYLGMDARTLGRGLVFHLAQGRLMLMPADAMPPGWPAATAPVLPFPAAISVSVADPAKARAVLQANAVPFVENDGSLFIAREYAGGVTLCFHAEPGCGP